MTGRAHGRDPFCFLRDERRPEPVQSGKGAFQIAHLADVFHISPAGPAGDRFSPPKTLSLMTEDRVFAPQEVADGAVPMEVMMEMANYKVLGVSSVLSVMAAMAAVGVMGQVGPGVRHVVVDGGLDIVGPAAGQTFRIEIRGRGASRLRTMKKCWYRVEGIRFELFSEENSKFVMTDVPVALGERVVLELYRSDIERRFPGDKVRSSWVKLAGGRAAILIVHETRVAAPDGDRFERDLFLVTTGPAQVFGLFAPIPAGTGENEVRRFLTRTLATLTFHEAPAEIF